MDRIPGNSLDSSDGRWVRAFDSESRDFIKGGAAGVGVDAIWDPAYWKPEVRSWSHFENCFLVEVIAI
jgi:hypothetical protein